MATKNPTGSIVDGVGPDQGGRAVRRSYGTGSLIVRTDRNGREVFYGKWRATGRVKSREVV